MRYLRLACQNSSGDCSFRKLDPAISQNAPDTIVTTMKSVRSNNYPLPHEPGELLPNPQEMSRRGSP